MKSNKIHHPRGVGCEESFPGYKYTAEETAFLMAMDRYKRTKRRPYPTWLEVLNVLRSLGYRKIDTQPTDPPSAA